MANRFAAFAPVAGIVMPSPCDPGRKVPILAFHGTVDPILYFNGGVGTAVLNHALGGGPAPTTTTAPPTELNGKGYPANVKAWATKDGCNLRTDRYQGERARRHADLPVSPRCGRRVLHRPRRRPRLAREQGQRRR